MAQSVKRPTSAQVMISRSVSSSPASGSVLTAQSLEPASDSVSPHLWVMSLSHWWGAEINLKKKEGNLGDSVESPTSAQVMISRFMSSSPTWGSVLTAQSQEPALDSV